MTQAMQPYDAIIIGGGPAGATAALCLARRGRRVVVLEKSRFPRLHVGESFLPAGFELIRALDLGDRLARLPHVQKFGAEFGFGAGEEVTLFSFADSLFGEGAETFNIERAPFDQMVLEAAADAGAEVRMNHTARRIVRLTDGDVAVDVEGEVLTGRVLLDASGQSTLLGRHLGLRRGMPHHRKIAYFGHFENVRRLPGKDEGHPTVAMCDEGWFWMINIDPRRTSIGLVIDADAARAVDRPASEMLFWGIERCPMVRDRLTASPRPSQTHTIADFSFHCRPCAGPGFFLIGDAAFFVDPIFSSGVALGMYGAVKAAELVDESLERWGGAPRRDGGPPRSLGRIRREYRRFVHHGTSPFLRLVNLFYDHSFRELFMHGRGPFEVQRAIISLLGGYVFPKPVWPLRWRLWLLAQFARLQRYYPLVRRRDRFSLLTAPAVELYPVEAERRSA